MHFRNEQKWFLYLCYLGFIFLIVPGRAFLHCGKLSFLNTKIFLSTVR